MLDKLLCYIKECSQANVSIDVGQVVHDASFNMICSTLFSMDLDSDGKIKEIKELMNCIIKEIGRPNIVDCYPFLKSIDPQLIRHRLTSYCVKLFKLFDEILEVRLKSKEVQAKCSRSYNDLLDVIVEVMDDQRDEIKREHIHHLLLLEEEINGVMGRGNTTILESNIIQLPYLHAIVTETLRLHPSAPLLLPRKLEKDINIDGYFLPKGAMLIINAWTIGRDPLLGLTRIHSPRSDSWARTLMKEDCPGIPLALKMSHLVLANLISNFDWKLDNNNNIREGEDLDMDGVYGITMKKAKSLRAFPIQRS
ncbi:Geraniol 8-hydroxylase [Bienertia sinuspersici]